MVGRWKGDEDCMASVMGKCVGFSGDGKDQRLMFCCTLYFEVCYGRECASANVALSSFVEF